MNRVALVGCGVHAFPVDSVIHDHFDHAGVIDEDSTPNALCARLERAVRAADTETRFWAIESAAAKPKRKSSAGSKKSTKKSGAGASKKTAKKTSGRTSKASSKKTTRKKTGKSA